ncbi:MAG: histidine kinase, partial [Clostridium saccharoperbutylacetonicum]
MDYIDIISTIFQSILFVYTINYCLGYKKIFDKKLVLSVIILSMIGYIIPNKFGNVSICVFVTHILCMLVVILFYNKKYIEALLALNLSYSIVMLSVFTFGNLLYEFIEQIIFKEHNDIFKAIFIYLFQFVMCITCMKFAKVIKEFYKILIDGEFSLISILLFSFIPDFVISFYIIRYKNEPPLLKNVIFMLLFIFILII